MAIIKFLRTALNRVIHKELVDTKFVGFSEVCCLLTFDLYKHVKTHIFPMGMMEDLLFKADSVL